MAIRIAAWNTEGRLGQRTTKSRGSPEHILEGIRQLDADVVVLPEVYYEQIGPGVDDQLHALGYEWADVRYDDVALPSDNDDRPHAVHLRILSRLPLLDVQRHRFQDVRTLMSAAVMDPATKQRIRILATHLDDRSEALRMKQVAAVVDFINGEDMQTVMLGDFNAMWDSVIARGIRSAPVRWLAAHVPGVWLRSIATRFTDMASGTALQFLAEQAGLRDADIRRQPTSTPKLRGVEWLPSIRMAQLDHILISSELIAETVAVMPDGGSDHRAIITTIRLKD